MFYRIVWKKGALILCVASRPRRRERQPQETSQNLQHDPLNELTKPA